MPTTSGKAYQRSTVYLTAEQRQWLRRIAGQAQLDDLPISASDVVRLALTRLQDQLGERELRKALIAHVQAEVEEYPGRARRGLPEAAQPQD
jgi:hypothetical protein